jgi:hypothetical protein
MAKMSKNTLPRLIINALCTTCGEVSPQVESITSVQEAVTHVARSNHVVILNGTVDAPDEQALASLTSGLDDPDDKPRDRELGDPEPLDLLEEYWKAGCQCLAEGAELCVLCKKTEPVLRAAGRLSIDV